MIKYAVYAKNNPCGSVKGFYLTKGQHYQYWYRRENLTSELGLSINEAFEELNKQRKGSHSTCSCCFEVIELKDGIPNHPA